MSITRSGTPFALAWAAAATLACSSVWSQTPATGIERVRAGDSALSCVQLDAAVAEMNTALAEASAAQSSGNTTATAGAVGSVAADVAERAGLFGSIAGLGGQLFGKLAAKTTAEVAQQSGQASAQEAANRMQQAKERKGHLLQLALGKGCTSAEVAEMASASSVAASVVAPSASVSSVAVATAPTESVSKAVELPDLDPSQWFDGKMGGTFGEKTVNAFVRSNRVAIAGLRIVFVTHNETSAITRGSYMPGGRETGTAKAKMEIDLQGVDDATLQAITDAAYQRLVAQLKAAGREVMTAEQLQPLYADFNTSAVPQEVTLAALRGRAFTPRGVPLWWQGGDAWGDSGLSQANMRAFNELSKSANALAIAPAIVIDFARMQSSGNRSGLTSSSASVGASLTMSVSSFNTRVVRAEETRYGGIVFKGDDGALTLTHRIDTDAEFADLQKVEENNKGTVMSLFGALGAKSSQSVSVAKTNNAAYSQVAHAVLKQATGAFAKLFAAYPVAQ